MLVVILYTTFDRRVQEQMSAGREKSYTDAPQKVYCAETSMKRYDCCAETSMKRYDYCAETSMERYDCTKHSTMKITKQSL